ERFLKRVLVLALEVNHRRLVWAADVLPPPRRGLPFAPPLQSVRRGELSDLDAVFDAGAAAPGAELADRPLILDLQRQRQCRLSLRAYRGKFAGKPARFGPGGGDRGEPLQLFCAAGQLPRLVERAPGLGIAAASAQPAK